MDFSVICEIDTGYENQMPVSLYDLNQDQIPEVFNVNDAMKLTILDGKSGGKILQYQIKDQNYQTDVGIVNLAIKDNPYLVVNYDSRTIKFMEITGVHKDKTRMLWMPGM